MPQNSLASLEFGLENAPLVYFDELESTNLWLKEHAEQYPHGTVVLADSQTGGRGRFDRVWRSPASTGLYFSLLLRPSQLPLWQWPHLTQVAALVLASLLRKQGVEVQAKWPNDLLVDAHKFCGILAEKIGQGNQAALILGMGINVNTPREAFAGLDRKATSLAIVTQTAWNRTLLLQDFLNDFSLALTRFTADGLSPWLTEWRQMPNFIGSRARLVLNAEQIYWGTVQGIQDDGSLLFLADGQSQAMPIYSGDLEV